MTRLRCAILDDYQQVALAMADWSVLADRTDVQAFHTRLDGEDEAARVLSGFDIVVAMRERTPLPASLLSRLPRLRLIVTTGMKNAAIDVRAARAGGVLVCGTASLSTPPAELTWALILGLARHLPAETAAFRSGGPWQHTMGVDLHGSRLGIVGLGRIGSNVARIGRAFGMDVQAWSPHLTRERAEAEGVALAPSLDDLLESSDWVSIHLVLGPGTRGLIGAAELGRMRPTSFLVNTSRAAIVDEAALLTALREGRIAGAGLDVFDTEPLPHDHPLRSLPNVLATPHLGYVSQANYRIFYREAVEDIAAFLAGRPVRVIDQGL